MAAGKRASGLLVACFLYLVMSNTQMVASMQLAALSEPYPTLDGVAAGGRAMLQADGSNMTQSAVGLSTLEAFRSLASAVQLQDVGDGANLQRLNDAVDKVKQAYSSVTTLAGPAARAHAVKRIVGIEQLLFKTVTTALGDVALAAGLLALAAFITLTVAGAFFAAAGGTLVGAQAAALAATRSVRSFKNSTNDTAVAWYDTDDFQSLTSDLDEASHNVVDWALTAAGPVDLLDFAFNVVGLASVITSPEVTAARNEAQATIQGATDAVSSALG